MDYMEALAGQAEWVANNLGYNLGFIPADKLNWKPAPTANSALEIVNHVVTAVKRLGALLRGDSPDQVDFAPATTLEEARNLLNSAVQEYAQTLRAVKPEDLSKSVTVPFGTFPLARMASFAVTDLIHHHGQIAYIQTLLGDTETHFDLTAMQ